VAIPIERLRKALNPQGWPEFEAVASENKGVSETLRAACKAVLARLGTGHAAAPAPAPAAASAAVPVAAHAAGAGSSPSPLAGPHVPQAGTALATPPTQPQQQQLPLPASPASPARPAPVPGSGSQFLRSPAFAPRPAAAPAATPPPAPAAPAAKPPVLPANDRTRRP
jgi:hypothetical protein